MLSQNFIIFVFIRYDENMSLWKATHQQHREFLATSNGEKKSFLLGRQMWTIYNDSEACSLKKAYTAILKLTGCSEDQFTCDDGSCVPMSNRCDGKSDCLDETDEVECKAFVQARGYNRFLVPPPAKNETDLRINYAFDVKDIIEINEKDGFLRCKILFKRRWYDRRVTFQNLHAANIINPEDQSLLWRPKTIFNNMEDEGKKSRTDRKETWMIRSDPNTSFALSDENFVHNTYLFDGGSNKINLYVAYTAEWLCDFHMEWYPFDTQICRMEFLQQQASVRPIPEKVEFDDITLQKHFIKGSRM